MYPILHLQVKSEEGKVYNISLLYKDICYICETDDGSEVCCMYLGKLVSFISTTSYEILIKKMDFLFTFKTKLMSGYKETAGKLFYELDFSFITAIAERMASNKYKYPIYNWVTPMTDEALENMKQAIFRHVLAVMQGELEDEGREYGHLEAIVCNIMIYMYQLKLKKKTKIE